MQDLDLQKADPLFLTSFIRSTEFRVPILLLHTYPFQRNSGCLGQMFPHVFLDVGLPVSHDGIPSTRSSRNPLSSHRPRRSRSRRTARARQSCISSGVGYGDERCPECWAPGLAACRPTAELPPAGVDLDEIVARPRGTSNVQEQGSIRRDGQAGDEPVSDTRIQGRGDAAVRGILQDARSMFFAAGSIQRAGGTDGHEDAGVQLDRAERPLELAIRVKRLDVTPIVMGDVGRLRGRRSGGQGHLPRERWEHDLADRLTSEVRSALTRPEPPAAPTTGDSSGRARQVFRQYSRTTISRAS